jgi:cell division protease FtsH
VHRVTIIPRSIGALGATLQLPTQDRYLVTADELRDRICVMMGGRVAEQLAFGTLSSGAQNDLERATEVARQMVCRFGMSAKLGPVSFGREEGGFLAAGLALDRTHSERTAQLIDAEVRALLEREEARAQSLLEARRASLDALVAALLGRETVERAELAAISAESSVSAATAPARNHEDCCCAPGPVRGERERPRVAS